MRLPRGVNAAGTVTGDSLSGRFLFSDKKVESGPVMLFFDAGMPQF
ncbi:hypothetical protein ACQRA4_13630 [Desulfovibrio sp. SGI.169]